MKPDAGNRRVVTVIRSLVALAAAAVLLPVLAGCTDGPAVEASDDPSGDEANSSTLPPCGEVRRIVVLDFFGVLTLDDREDHEAVHWIQDPGDEPSPRPGGAGLAQAYVDLGYELLVVHMAPESVPVGGVPISEAISDWLERHGFPKSTAISGWDDTSYWDLPHREVIQSPAYTDLVQTLLRLSLTDGITVDIGYTHLEERAQAFRSIGIPHERVFGVGRAMKPSGTTVALPDDDLRAHAAGVGTLIDPACER